MPAGRGGAPPRRRPVDTVLAALLAAVVGIVGSAALAGCTTVDDASAGSGGSTSTSTSISSDTGTGTGESGDGGSTSTPSPSAASDPQDGSAAVRQAVAALVAARAAAMAGRDRAAWLATVADPGAPFGTAQGDLYDRLVTLPVTGLTATEVDVSPATPGAADWVANLRLAYRFDGYDQGDRTFRVSYALARTAAGWRLAGPGPGRTDAQPFDLPGVRSLRSPSTLVIGDVPDATLRTYLELGDAARPRIEQAWGSARPGVLVAPQSTDELQSQLGRGSIAGLDQVAAITDGPLATGTPAASDRVYLNPAAFAKLSPTGRGVVITHELTHVTVRGSTTRPVPIWLSEGYADDVAFGASGLPVKTVAADLFAQVRAGQVPTALPGVPDFDPARGAISPVYNEAWLAVVLLRQTYGAARLSAFYRAVSGGPTADPSVTGSADDRTRAAFVDVLGTTQDAFVTAWRADLVRLAA